MAKATSSASSSTIRSLDILHTELPPNAPQQYLTHFVVQSLLRKGFDGAEAGALTEIERLLERHIQNVFASSHSFAHLAGRSHANAFDILSAREQEGMSGMGRLKRESKKRRRPMQLEMISAPPTPPAQTRIEDLPDPTSLASRLGGIQPLAQVEPHPQEGEDRKPNLGDLDVANTAATAAATGTAPISAVTVGPKIVKVENGFEGAPGLPPKWTFPDVESDQENADPAPQTTSTKTSLDFVKLTASQSGGLPPELGVVNYRTQGRRGRVRIGVSAK